MAISAKKIKTNTWGTSEASTLSSIDFHHLKITWERPTDPPTEGHTLIEMRRRIQ